MSIDNDSHALLLEQLLNEQRQYLAELDDRDYANLLIPELDYTAQLTAIEALLRRNAEADRALKDEILRIESFVRRSTGLRNERAEDEWMEHLHASVYQDAAHSMAAVGMLAPFVESLLYQAFTNLRGEWIKARRGIPSHPRFHQHDDEKAWDCHWYWTGRGFQKDIVKGTKEIASAIGLASRLPSAFWKIMEALVAYRNKMFHHGFEWPQDERRKFADRIQRDWDSTWFESATSGEKPWIFYLSEVFISSALGTVDQIVLALGSFARELFVEQQAPH